MIELAAEIAAMMLEKAAGEIIGAFEVHVSSSAIRTVGYNPDSEDLDIGFTDGASHTYANVPPDVVAALLSASSIGVYFNRNIRNDYG